MATKSFDKFRTTVWEEVDLVRDADSAVREAARSRLISRYLPALRAHLVLRKRLDDQLADDLLQGFVADKMLQHDLFSRADRQLGKLRSLLTRSLENYVRDYFRSRGKQPAWLGEEHFPAKPATSVAVDFIDVAWARQLIEETISFVRYDCRRHNQNAIWRVFEERLLRPLHGNCSPPHYQELADRLNFRSPRQAENALITAKRKFKRAFVKIVSCYLAEGEDIQNVIGDVIRILSVANSHGWQSVSGAWTDQLPRDTGLRAELDEMQPAHLARLVDLDHHERQRNSKHLGELLRHQLVIPLQNWISDTPEVVLNLDSSVRAKPLGQLFDSANTPPAALALITRAAKRKVRDRDLPYEVALVLYVGSVAAAMVHRGARITLSDDDILAYGLSRVLTFNWVDDKLRQLLATALKGFRKTDVTDVVEG